MVALKGFGEANVFWPRGAKRGVSLGFGAKMGLESEADAIRSGVLPMHAHTTGAGCRDGSVCVDRRRNRQSAHEVSGGDTAGHRYDGRIPMRIIVPIPQRGQRLRSFSVMASSSWRQSASLAVRWQLARKPK